MSDVLKETRARRHYVTRATIDRTVEAVRANGIRVTSVTVTADGSITLSSAESGSSGSGTMFDALDRAGRL